MGKMGFALSHPKGLPLRFEGILFDLILDIYVQLSLRMMRTFGCRSSETKENIFFLLSVVHEVLSYLEALSILTEMDGYVSLVSLGIT